MALRGNLKDFSLPDVFQLVQLSRKTGVLRVSDASAQGSIWFRDGEVFFAQSNWRKDRFGERLVNAQRITPAALERALEIQASESRGGRRLGEILVAEGYITQQVLESFVVGQIQDTIFDLMRWDSGLFDFEVLPSALEEDIGLSVSVENIVMEGSRRLEEWQRIKKKIPSMDMVFKMATAPGEGAFEISLKPAEWTLLLSVDGTRTVHELALETRATDFDVSRTIYGLFSAGLLEVAADEEVEQLRLARDRRQSERAALEAARRKTATEIAAEEAQSEATETDESDLTTQPAPGVFRAPGEMPAAEPTLASHEESGFSAEHPAPAGSPLPEPLASSVSPLSSDETDVLEQMMSAVLGLHGETVSVIEEEVTAAPPMPAAEAAPSDLEPLPSELEPAPVLFEAALPAEMRPPAWAGFEPTGDFEADVRTLGLGEYPVELLRGAVASSAGPSVPELAPGQVTVDVTPVEIVADSRTTFVIQFDAVRRSQDQSGLEPAPWPEPGVSEEPEEHPVSQEAALGLEPRQDQESRLEAMPTVAQGFELAPVPLWGREAERTTGEEADELKRLLATPAGTTLISTDAFVIDESAGPAAGVGTSSTARSPEEREYISTDAFLSDLENVGLASGFGDELAALTGADKNRPRPQAVVKRVPDVDEGKMLHRDQAVDKALILRIIEGIEQL